MSSTTRKSYTPVKLVENKVAEMLHEASIVGIMPKWEALRIIWDEDIVYKVNQIPAELFLKRPVRKELNGSNQYT